MVTTTRTWKMGPGISLVIILEDGALRLASVVGHGQSKPLARIADARNAAKAIQADVDAAANVPIPTLPAPPGPTPDGP